MKNKIHMDDVSDASQYSKVIFDHFFELLDGHDLNISMAILNLSVFKIICNVQENDIEMVKHSCKMFSIGFSKLIETLIKLNIEKNSES